MSDLPERMWIGSKNSLVATAWDYPVKTAEAYIRADLVDELIVEASDSRFSDAYIGIAFRALIRKLKEGSDHD